MAGLPPLSGFLGKLLVSERKLLCTSGGLDLGRGACVQLVSILGFARAGSILFWKAESLTLEGDPSRSVPRPLSYVAVGGLIVLLLRIRSLRGRCMAIQAKWQGSSLTLRPIC